MSKRSSIELSRRSFLKAVGFAGAAALPFFKLLERSAVDAQAGTVPLRFVGIYHPHGVSKELWNLRPGETETSFDITYENCSLSPFDDAATYGASFKDKLLIIEGVDLKAAHDTETPGHSASAAILTGSGPGAAQDANPKNQSLDQYLARDRGLGADTPFATVELAVGNWANGSGAQLAYAKDGSPLPKIVDPTETFDRLFASLVVGSDPAAQAAAARKRAQGHSVLDFVAGDVQRLNGRLAGPEKDKLDQHLTAIRGIEKRLDGLGAMGCMVPTRPQKTGNADPSLDFPQVYANNGGEPYFDRITDLQIDLLAQALACDLTRFSTLWLIEPGKELTNLAPPLPFDVHNDVAHRYSDMDVTSQIQLAHMNRYSYQKIARLMQRLNEMGILDNTLLYASSDMGDPSLHSTMSVPMILAGGANGYFRMGRHIAMPPKCPNNDWCANPTLVSHNPILVSIANAFGVTDIDTYGTPAPDDPKGPFPNLR